MTFKEKLVKLRKLKGLTQDEFASAVGVSRQAVYKWESGQSYPEVAKLIEIKLLFGISIDDLLDDTYEVIVPEKKKKRRISTEAKKKIEEEVRSAEGSEEEKEEVAEVEVAESSVEEAVAVTAVAEEVKEEAEVHEEVASEVKEDVAEEATVAEEAPATEEAPAQEKRRGFFAKLFGKK